MTPGTRRQQEILVLLRQGLSDAETAGRLLLPARTVCPHVPAVLAKLGVRSRGRGDSCEK